MPLYQVTGWDSITARQATWYLRASSETAASFYASNAGLTSPLLSQIVTLPDGERAIDVEHELSKGTRARPDRIWGDRLVWRIALGVMLGILGASMVLSALRSSGR